jgi:hypothetical protein
MDSQPLKPRFFMHPFRNGCRYRHDNCLDIDIEVTKVQYATPDYVKARIRIIYRNAKPENELIVTLTGTYLVKEHWERWKRII